ncbi:MAG: hypothetical protein GF418_13895 [Chitinivibrionales bacterium]|nr:hypothetical protein [Chitinivibrionales bacterium]MBD3396714.1 hypothetical protein [Chitinivibrionales bacterium]
MRVYTLLVACAAVVTVCVVSSYAADSRFVKIKKPFANVYEYLDPRSKIVQQAKKGDYFELVYEGTSWYQVRVADRVGWVERRAGNVVEDPGLTILSIPVGTFVLFILLLLGTFAGASLFIYRQKTAEL